MPLALSQTVTGVQPSAGASGSGGEQMVTINGSGFTGATDVFFGPGTDVSSASSYPCPSSTAGCFQIQSDAEILADTPVETAGTVDVTVGSGSVNPGDQYSYFDPPTVASVASPQQQGATGIAITGTNFSYPAPAPLTNGVSEVDLVPKGGGSTVALTAVCSTGSQPNCFAFTDATDLTINLPTSVIPGQYDTEVITPGGTSATSSGDVLNVLPLPTLTSLNPTSGSTLGGNNVILTGTNFTGATDVNFGPMDITTVCGTGTCFSIGSDTQITVHSAPAHAAGGVNVTVTTPGGTTGSQLYTYVTPLPTLTSLNPTSGSTLGGNNVILTGTNFTGATDVNFGPMDITTVCGTGTCFSIDSDTQITVHSAPAHAAGGVNVTVTTPGGTTGSQLYTYVTPLPTLTSLNPTSGSTLGGNNVILTGTNFTGATDVNFGPMDITTVCGTGTCFSIDSDTQITVHSAPAHAAGGVNVTVTTPGGTTGSQLYTYVTPLPTLTSLNPTSGSTLGGNNVTLTGTNFTGATDVHVGTTDLKLCGTGACFAITSDTQITVTMPSSATAGPFGVTVTTPGGTTISQSYTYYSPPTLTGISPAAGPIAGGTSVTLTGSNFIGATDVHVGTTDLKLCGTGACFTIGGATQITVTMPSSATAGPFGVTVTTPGGTTASQTYTYYSLPTLTGISPAAGPIAGGTSVTLTGSNFTGATDVHVGTTDLKLCGTGACFTIGGATQITVTMPSSVAGPFNVNVTTPGGLTGNQTYTYFSAPTLTGISPAAGPIAGGTSVTSDRHLLHRCDGCARWHDGPEAVRHGSVLRDHQ